MEKVYMYLFTLAQLACSFIVKIHYKITYYIFRDKKGEDIQFMWLTRLNTKTSLSLIPFVCVV